MKRIEQGFIMMRMQNLKPILLVNILISIEVSQSQLFLLRYVDHFVKLIITVWHKYMSFCMYLQLYVQCNLILFYSWKFWILGPYGWFPLLCCCWFRYGEDVFSFRLPPFPFWLFLGLLPCRWLNSEYMSGGGGGDIWDISAGDPP